MNTNDVIKNIDTMYDSLNGSTDRDLSKEIESNLDAGGIMYRIFYRTKSRASVISKMKTKAETYLNENRKMQDLIGIRIVLYFSDDIDICINILKELFEIDNYEYDHSDTETFRPQRINFVFKIPSNISFISSKIQNDCLIDNTFEVQIRTTLSEGWHEVEHDIRYKYQNLWKYEPGLSRELNGILAVLEVCDNNIISICEKLAYKKYKENAWEAMIRMKFRMRLQQDPLSNELSAIIDENKKTIGRSLLRFSRVKVISYFRQTRLPRRCDNVVYIINLLELHNPEIDQMTPEVVRRKIEELNLH